MTLSPAFRGTLTVRICLERCIRDRNRDECVTHILNYGQKSGCNGFTDGEIFCLLYTSNVSDSGTRVQIVVGRLAEMRIIDPNTKMVLMTANIPYLSLIHI